MKSSVLLRVTSVLAAVQGTAHGALVLTAKPRHGAAEIAVLDAAIAGCLGLAFMAAKPGRQA
jgi:hypothetical protein